MSRLCTHSGGDQKGVEDENSHILSQATRGGFDFEHVAVVSWPCPRAFAPCALGMATHSIIKVVRDKRLYIRTQRMRSELGIDVAWQLLSDQMDTRSRLGIERVAVVAE